MQRLGGTLLEDLLALDRGYRGPRVDCGGGHLARFVGYRDRQLDTILGPVGLRRAWYHCPDCGAGLAPRDRELGVAGASLSAGLARMVARVGAHEPFAQARRDLAELAGVELTAKRVERSAEASGARIRAAAHREAAALLAGTIVALGSTEPVERLYVAIDGTGVPTVPGETEGRRGKAPDGRARTREVKVGCLFTQTGLDERGRPVRDPGSSSYLAVVESAERFGELVYAEAVRRGLERAETAVVIGDGARWIWNLADEHFPDALQIVDLYHAREHLHAVARLANPDDRAWLDARLAELDQGAIEALLEALADLAAAGPVAEALREVTSYFANNRERMRYARFRALGCFVGSGVVEAGCRTLVGQRLKQSGMRWTVRGAESIISLRCAEASGRWDEVWKWLRPQTAVA